MTIQLYHADGYLSQLKKVWRNQENYLVALLGRCLISEKAAEYGELAEKRELRDGLGGRVFEETAEDDRLAVVNPQRGVDFAIRDDREARVEANYLRVLRMKFCRNGAIVVDRRRDAKTNADVDRLNGWKTGLLIDGTSTVTITRSEVRLMRSTKAASAVVFPLPVGPVNRTRPFGRTAKDATVAGNPSVSSMGTDDARKRRASRSPVVVR